MCISGRVSSKQRVRWGRVHGRLQNFLKGGQIRDGDIKPQRGLGVDLGGGLSAKPPVAGDWL